jgi:hypothetical protein
MIDKITRDRLADYLSSWINNTHWKENNVDQCWTCANLVGGAKRDIGYGLVILPECKVAERYMTEVYDRPCRAYKPRTAEGG